MLLSIISRGCKGSFISMYMGIFRELVIIQASPFTKDYRDVYKTIGEFAQAGISVQVGSLVGSTYVYEKLV